MEPWELNVSQPFAKKDLPCPALEKDHEKSNNQRAVPGMFADGSL
jgi:hypothetical protein